MIKNFLIFLLIIQNHCLLNPLVQDILNLENSKQGNNFLKVLLALNVSQNRLPPTATITPSIGNIILSNSSLKVTFSKSMDPSSLIATLGKPLSASWSQSNLPNDTVHLSGSIPVGTNNFLLEAKDYLGISLAQLSGTYIVLSSDTKIFYVSTSGNDGNSGSSGSLPKLTITSAVSNANAPAAIFISAGNYNVDSVLSTNISLVEGVSLYGGFSQDFSSRNISTFISKITDTSTGVIVDTSTIIAGSSITLATVVDGLTIIGSSNSSATGDSYAIRCSIGSPMISNNIIQAGSLNANIVIAVMADAASPTISNNTITGGTSVTNSTFGIFMQNGSSATIKNNNIHGGTTNTVSAHAIYTGPQANNPTISGNTLYGGSGSLSYGLNNSHPSSPNVSDNTIDGGIGTTTYAIYHGTGAGNVGSYQSNSLFTTGGTNRYCLYEAGAGSSPVSFNYNHLFNCPTALYFDQGSVPINSLTTINGSTTNGASYTGNF